jgi:NADH-quinone oxidoreductase subunit H
MHEFNLLYTILTIVGVLAVIPSICGFLIYAERKVSAWVQDRVGPNRVGPLGLLQSLADGLKFILKEEIIPRHVDRFVYVLAPALSLSTALLAFAVVPFGPTTPPPLTPVPPSPPAAPASAEAKAQYDAALAAYRERAQNYERQAAEYRDSYQFVIAPGVDIGILFVFAVASLNVYGIILGGWAANNKYTFIGGLRASAQIISYEIPMGLSILGIVLLTGSLNMEWMIQEQVEPRAGGWGGWNVLIQPLAFLLFMTSSFAETNRLPFDLPEAEQELVGGWHTEYSAMKFAMFFLGEYSHVITTSFILVVAFFGGWHLPFIAGPDAPWFVKGLVFFLKMSFFILFIMLIRWTIPRFRFDQLMGLAWKVLIPLATLNLICVMVVREFRLSPWLLLPASAVLLVGAGWVALLLPSPTASRRVTARDEAPLQTVGP